MLKRGKVTTTGDTVSIRWDDRLLAAEITCDDEIRARFVLCSMTLGEDNSVLFIKDCHLRVSSKIRDAEPLAFGFFRWDGYSEITVDMQACSWTEQRDVFAAVDEIRAVAQKTFDVPEVDCDPEPQVELVTNS